MSVSRWGIIGTAIGLVAGIIVMVLAAVVFTPLGEHLPITNQKLEAQYGKQINDIQRQMHLLLQGVNTLRGYNLKLRRAMGEKISTADSLALMNLDLKAAEASSPGDRGNGFQNGAVVMRDQSAMAGPRYAGLLKANNTLQDSRTVQPVRFPLTQPVDGFVTREFSSKDDHFGVDFAGRPESPVHAAADGIVVFSGWTYEDGYVLILAHSAGYVSVYKHNQSLLRSVGDAVRRQEIIALLGNTGRTSTGPHLHFEIWRDGVVQDPANYLLTNQ